MWPLLWGLSAQPGRWDTSFSKGLKSRGKWALRKAWKEFLGRAGGRVFEWGVRFLLTWIL